VDLLDVVAAWCARLEVPETSSSFFLSWARKASFDRWSCKTSESIDRMTETAWADCSARAYERCDATFEIAGGLGGDARTGSGLGAIATLKAQTSPNHQAVITATGKPHSRSNERICRPSFTGLVEHGACH
jgi:hypothetical protein